MAVIGTILGDIAGSQYEFFKPDDVDYETCDLFTKDCTFTDDTVLTLATKYAVLNNLDFANTYKRFARMYPDAGYGTGFERWVKFGCEPYNSYGNGSAMRVSFIGEHFENLKDVQEWAEKSAACTHNHPEGIKGAVATATCIWMAKHGRSKEEIYEYGKSMYPKSEYKYGVDLCVDSYKNSYEMNETCQDSVPVAIRCFLESHNYESFIRKVFEIPCDMDTICAIGGGIAEEFYKNNCGFNIMEWARLNGLSTDFIGGYLSSIAGF